MPKVRNISRLRFSNFEVLDGYEYWGRVEYPEIREQPDDIFYRVQDSDRIDLLAYRFYGDHGWLWILALANDIDIYPTQLVSGMTLRIPSLSYAKSLFSKAKF